MLHECFARGDSFALFFRQNGCIIAKLLLRRHPPLLRNYARPFLGTYAWHILLLELTFKFIEALLQVRLDRSTLDTEQLEKKRVFFIVASLLRLHGTTSAYRSGEASTIPNNEKPLVSGSYVHRELLAQMSDEKCSIAPPDVLHERLLKNNWAATALISCIYCQSSNGQFLRNCFVCDSAIEKYQECSKKRRPTRHRRLNQQEIMTSMQPLSAATIIVPLHNTGKRRRHNRDPKSALH